ncbi:MAG TPA: tyrosine-type recombinase/integrase [Acidimicrobiales bacterium]|nr:tyrosine-type recombinase/integrase [Acidimicrobiales bacterium]
MPAKPEGVYPDARGQWYFKVTLGRDPLSGRREQITRRGFRTAAEAAKARRELLGKVDAGLVKPSPSGITVDELLDLYLDGLDADQRLSPKTRYDYRIYAATWVRGYLGKKRVRDITPEILLTWQRKLLKEGGVIRVKKVEGTTKGKTQNGVVKTKPLSPNTIRLARAPLAGAFKLATSSGIIAVNPLLHIPQPKARRSIPRHWSPDEARTFLGLMEGDRTYSIWAFLMGSGLRIGELVALRWPNVDLASGVVHVVEFSTYLGHEIVSSSGKSQDAVRGIDIDAGLIKVLKAQQKQQKIERLAENNYVESNYVFAKPGGGPYHPQYLSRLLGKYTEELGLPRLTAHGLRHTCATLMLANGVPPKVAAERLGHSDPSLFMNLYSHVTPTMQREAAEKIGAALFG